MLQSSLNTDYIFIDTIFLGNEPAFVDGYVFGGAHSDFRIIVLPDSVGFGKPNPYNNETSWEWNTYNVVISDDDGFVSE